MLERMLALARAQPLPEGEKLPASVDLGLDRALSCPSDEEFDAYAAAHPYGGMPYGVAPLSDREYATLVAWGRGGAAMPDASAALPAAARASVEKWERFLNAEQAKQPALLGDGRLAPGTRDA